MAPFANPSERRQLYELKVVRVPVTREESLPYASRGAITKSQEIFEMFRDRFKLLDREEFLVVLLDGK